MFLGLVYGNNVKIKVQVNSSAISSLNIGKVVVKVNNVEYSANIKNGIGTIIIPKLNTGNYKINVKYIDHNLPKKHTKQKSYLKETTTT